MAIIDKQNVLRFFINNDKHSSNRANESILEGA